ncbi:MAG: DsrE family protein [Bacteroidales bacterium]|nr:DsrE family protein [Bacteroidales bacterium]
MKKQTLLIIALLMATATRIWALEPANDTTLTKDDRLVVVWTSGDKEVAMKMVCLYTFNAMKRGWWKEVTLLVWGPSAKLLSEDEELQEYVKKIKAQGVELLACKGCADMYGVEGKLKEIGVTVRYTGMDLTNFIKERHVITF